MEIHKAFWKHHFIFIELSHFEDVAEFGCSSLKPMTIDLPTIDPHSTIDCKDTCRRSDALDHERTNRAVIMASIGSTLFKAHYGQTCGKILGMVFPKTIDLIAKNALDNS